MGLGRIQPVLPSCTLSGVVGSHVQERERQWIQGLTQPAPGTACWLALVEPQRTEWTGLLEGRLLGTGRLRSLAAPGWGGCRRLPMKRTAPMKSL
jgi:hypothetical protein